MAATKIPKLLYQQCLKVYVSNVNEKLLNLSHNGYLDIMPPMVLLDIFTEMSTVESLRDALLAQFGNLNIFVKLLKFGGTKLKMFRCFSVLSSCGRPITNELVNQYNEQSDFMTIYQHQQTIPYDKESANCIETGLRVGSFLTESGWLQESLVVLDRVLSIVNKLDNDKLETYKILIIKLDCLQRLLHAQAGICCFKKANVTCSLAEQIIKKIGEDKIPDNLMASFYTKVSVLHYSRSDYNQSYEWSIKALKHCFQRTPHTLTIDVFRQAAKSCVLKRYFSKAHLLIQEAVRTARVHLGKHVSKYADALLDFGFYLLNVDSIVQSVDVYKMSTVESLRDALLAQFGNLNIFVKLLKFGGTKLKMFRCFSVLSSCGRPITNELVNQYNEQSDFMTIYQHQQTIPYDKESANCIETGLRVGSFLAESGWLQESLVVLDRVLSIVNKLDNDKLETYKILIIKLDCLQRLLHAQAGICCFKKANVTCSLAEQIIKKIGEDKIPDNLMASFYTKVSVLHYSRSDYNQSYEWSIKALKHCFQRTPHTLTIDVFRQAAKSCVLKRYFSKAHLLIQEAVRTARVHLGKHVSKYADALLDFGFYLLNVDSIVQSVDVYKEALEIKQYIFGTRNLHVAIATEDMSYALYVRDYSTGRFQNALDHVENSIRILKSIVPSNHLMLASAKRVKALILEEIALDNSTEGLDVHPLLLHAEELHQSALDLSLNVFGEMNVQTAKHYGNLGRLYQSMAKYYEAENMHKRAIKIKADILGEFDYEVGLSIGHLASLYNYHMKNYQEAERLYLRSINISLRLFGETYSGLEYDYRGLCHVYESLNDTEKYLEYALILDTWKQLKEDQNRVNKISYESKVDSTIDDITKQFFNIGKDVI